jgi:hypothetical protein
MYSETFQADGIMLEASIASLLYWYVIFQGAGESCSILFYVYWRHPLLLMLHGLGGFKKGWNVWLYK